MKITIEDKKKLVKEISTLSKNEHIEIFKIISCSTDKYTKNDNGIFINFAILPDDVVKKLINFVNFCIDNRENLKIKEEYILSETDKMFNNNHIVDNNDDNIDNNEENIIVEEVKTVEEEESDGEFEGAKISLKRSKPKYNGIKAKIIKNCKQITSTTSSNNIIKQQKNKKPIAEPIEILEESVYNIGDETCSDYNESDISADESE